MKNLILKLIGGISLALGVIGMFLPLLPSTCFIIMSTWAFSKSSPKFHHWLYYQSPFSKSIQDWQQHRMVPRKAKIIATLSLLTSFVITALMIPNPILLLVLAAGMSALLVFLITRDDEKSLNVVISSCR